MASHSSYPVVLFVYKRVSTTRKMLELAQAAGIQKIYLFADGPKKIADKIHTDQVRAEINAFQKNHQLEIITHYSPVNRGLKRNIIDGLNHVFAKEEAAIILEDDCLPTPDFFTFATQMLTRYRHANQVMSVTGTSVTSVSQFSYDFSKYQNCWGWATWQRAWDKYDENLTDLSSPAWLSKARKVWPHPLIRWYWQNMLSLAKVGQIDTWDFQWSFAHFAYGGLALTPTQNLVSNTGFDEMATNTKTWSPVADLKVSHLSWPLIHPKEVRENKELSDIIERKYYRNPIAFLGMFRQKIYWLLKKYADRS